MQTLFKTILFGLAAILAPAMIAGDLALSAAQTPQTSGQPVRVLAFGDSLTQGYGVPPGMEFPARLEKALNAKRLDVTVINAGVSGETSAGGLARVDWLLGDGKSGPDAVILELGANDGLRGLPVPEMEKNLDTILSKLKARNIPVLFAGMKAPRNFGARYAEDYDAVFPKLAAKYDALFYPFFLEGVALDRALVQPDGLHPNPKGVDVIVKGIEPLAERLAQQARARRAGAPTKK
jgi:acyl-CoA thioesterase-1